MTMFHRFLLRGIRKRSFSSSASIDAINDIRSLPWQFLRAADSSNYDPNTHQRSDVLFDVQTGKIPSSSKPNMASITIDSVSLQDDDHYNVIWSDGLSSTYSKSWVQQQLNQWKGETSLRRLEKKDRLFWSHLTEDDVRKSSILSLDFESLIHDETGMRRGLESLYKYGILLVTNTPIDDHQGEGVAALGAALSGGQAKDDASTTPSSLLANYRRGSKDISLPHGTDGPLRTLYGSIWSTTTAGQSDGASVADSAYGNEGLPLHTDMTYMRDPPGLQIFTMVQRAPQGGESIFADGFAIAQRLQHSNPAAFDILSQTTRRYRCVDQDTGWHLEASGPVITVAQNGQIVAIRHNDLDRLPDLPPPDILEPEEIAQFYNDLAMAHQAWDELISSDEFRLVVQLQPGETMVVANQRCFHGRFSFQASEKSPRSVMGCYISQDELYSRFRMEGFDI